MIRVGVVGAAGRMGREVCLAVAADPELNLVAAVDPHALGESIEGVAIVGGLSGLVDGDAEVAVDFTQPDAAADSVRWGLEHGVHFVVGTTGISPADLEDLRQRSERATANVLVAPNFAIGAVLMMRFAAQASEHMAKAEIIELHHDRKLDAPSGTAARTAELMAGEVPIHSVRLPGLVAHQEVILGDVGQTLTIRHDSVDRESFMPGVLLAVRRVGALPESPVVGLEHLLF